MSNPNSENSKLNSLNIQPSTSGTRLQSFKKRDLTLGAGILPSRLNKLTEVKNKKVHIPNLNVQRNKTKSELNVKVEKPKKETPKNKSKLENKNRNRGNLIQEQSIFADGVAPTKYKRYSSQTKDAEILSQKIDKIKISPNDNINTDSGENFFKSLSKDTFVEDKSITPDISAAPNQLPFLSNKKNEQEKKINTNLNLLEAKIKKEPEDNEYYENSSIKIKTEPKDEEEEEDQDKNLNASTKGEKIMMHKKQLSLIKFPDIFPMNSLIDETDNEDKSQKSIRSLNEGRLGTLVIHKSGKAYIEFGDLKLNAHIDSEIGMNKILMNAELDKSNLSGKLYSLGHIKNHITLAHDVNTLFLDKKKDDVNKEEK